MGKSSPPWRNQRGKKINIDRIQRFKRRRRLQEAPPKRKFRRNDPSRRGFRASSKAASSSSPESQTILMDVEDVRFAQSDIGKYFTDGRSLETLIEELCVGRKRPLRDNFLTLNAVSFGDKFTYTYNNRRLHCLKTYSQRIGKPVQVRVRVTPYPEEQHENFIKLAKDPMAQSFLKLFSTTCNGEEIRLRGDRPRASRRRRTPVRSRSPARASRSCSRSTSRLRPKPPSSPPPLDGSRDVVACPPWKDEVEHCKEGHRLLFHAVKFGQTYQCAECGRPVSSPEATYRCHVCEYDLCKSCHHGENDSEAADDSSHSDEESSRSEEVAGEVKEEVQLNSSHCEEATSQVKRKVTPRPPSTPPPESLLVVSPKLNKRPFPQVTPPPMEKRSKLQEDHHDDPLESFYLESKSNGCGKDTIKDHHDDPLESFYLESKSNGCGKDTIKDEPLQADSASFPSSLPVAKPPPFSKMAIDYKAQTTRAKSEAKSKDKRPQEQELPLPPPLAPPPPPFHLEELPRQEVRPPPPPAPPSEAASPIPPPPPPPPRPPESEETASLEEPNSFSKSCHPRKPSLIAKLLQDEPLQTDSPSLPSSLPRTIPPPLSISDYVAKKEQKKQIEEESKLKQQEFQKKLMEEKEIARKAEEEQKKEIQEKFMEEYEKARKAEEQKKQIEEESRLRQQEIQNEIARKAEEQKKRIELLRLQEIQKKFIEEKEKARKAEEQRKRLEEESKLKQQQVQQKFMEEKRKAEEQRKRSEELRRQEMLKKENEEKEKARKAEEKKRLEEELRLRNLEIQATRKRLEEEAKIRQQQIQKKLMEEKEAARKAEEEKKRMEELRRQENQKKLMEEERMKKKTQDFVGAIAIRGAIKTYRQASHDKHDEAKEELDEVVARHLENCSIQKDKLASEVQEAVAATVKAIRKKADALKKIRHAIKEYSAKCFGHRCCPEKHDKAKAELDEVVAQNLEFCGSQKEDVAQHLEKTVTATKQRIWQLEESRRKLEKAKEVSKAKSAENYLSPTPKTPQRKSEENYVSPQPKTRATEKPPPLQPGVYVLSTDEDRQTTTHQTKSLSIMASVTFKPGALGLRAESDEKTVAEIKEGGQAQRAGVEVGWRIVAVDVKPCESFKDQVFQDAREMNVPYQAIFEKAAPMIRPMPSKATTTARIAPLVPKPKPPGFRPSSAGLAGVPKNDVDAADEFSEVEVQQEDTEAVPYTAPALAKATTIAKIALKPKPKPPASPPPSAIQKAASIANSHKKQLCGGTGSMGCKAPADEKASTLFTVVLERTWESDVLGLHLEGDGFEINRIEGGIAAAHNARVGPVQKIRPGDRIIAVDGNRDAAAILERLQKASRMMLSLRRKPQAS